MIKFISLEERGEKTIVFFFFIKVGSREERDNRKEKERKEVGNFRKKNRTRIRRDSVVDCSTPLAEHGSDL